MTSETTQTPSDEKAAPAPQPASGRMGPHLWNLLAAAALIAIAVGVWLQWRTLDRIESMMLFYNRPWVVASVDPSRLVFDAKGGGITIKMNIKNGGLTPATDVLAGPILLLHDNKKSFRKVCGHYGVDGGIGPILLKGDAVEKTGTAWLSRDDFGKDFPNLVALCIKYRFAHGTRLGETGYLFAISRHEASGSDSYVIEANNGTITPPDLVLLPIGNYQD